MSGNVVKHILAATESINRLKARYTPKPKEEKP